MAGSPDAVGAQDAQPPHGRWTARDLAWAIGLAAAYVLAGKWGLSLALVSSSTSAVWPATGIAIAALLVLGLRFWPAILVGAFVVNLSTSGPVPAALIAVGNLLEGLLGAYAVQRWARGVRAFERPRDVFWFIALAGMAAPAVAASFGVLTLVLFGLAPGALAPAIWTTWWLGDAAGAVVLAPVLVLFAVRHRQRGVHEPLGEIGAILFCTALAGFLVFGPFGREVFGGRPYAFVTIPFVVWAALRLGPLFTSVAALLLDAIAIWGTIRGHGPFILADPNDSLLYLQAYIGVVALLTLPTAALSRAQALSQAQLREAAAELEHKVQQRTAELEAKTQELQRTSEEVLRAKDLLQASETRLRTIFQSVPNGILLSRPDGSVIDVNPGAVELWKLPRERFLDPAFRMSELYADPAQRSRVVQELQSKGHLRGLEIRMKRGDGQVRAMLFNSESIELAGESIFVATGQDITDLRAAEEAARLAEERFRSIFEASPVSLVVTRPDTGAVVDANEGFSRLTGYTHAEVTAPGFSVGVLYEDAAERARLVADVRRDGRIRERQLTLRRKDGSLFESLVSIESITVAGGPALLSAALDITDLREAERALREAEAAQRAILDNASDAIITGDQAATIVGWNHAAERIFGYSAGEAIGRPIATLLSPEQWEDYKRDIEAFRKGRPSNYVGRSREMEGRRKDGELLEIELSLGVWMSAQGPMFTGVARDIRARKEAERAKRSAQERFQSIFESSPVAISLTLDNGEFVDVNPAFCRLSGYTREELLGNVNASTIYEDPDDRGRILNAIRQRGSIREVELALRRRDGEAHIVLASIEYVDMGGNTTILGIFQDITERKHAEREREARIANEAELERLRRTDQFRMEFINSTAHELRTPLTPLLLGMASLRRDAANPESVQRHTASMQRAVDRLRRVVEDMVSAADLQARSIALDRQRLNLTRQLRAAVAAHMDQAHRANLALEQPEDSGLSVSADEQRLQLVLGHLMGNAIKFTPAGGRVWMTAKRDGDYARIEVHDTGIGLTARQLEGLWKPYAQAHDKAERTDSGSGLGLYVTRGIIELHKGEVGASSGGPGRGSTFWFKLPLATGHLDPLAKHKPGRDGGEARDDAEE